MPYRKLLLTLVAGLLTACGDASNSARQGGEEAFVAPHAMAGSRMARKENAEYLAYEHTVTVDIDEDGIADTFNSLLETCNNDDEHDCTLLDSSLSLGDYKSARIRLRINPEGVDGFIELAAAAGDVQDRNTHIEDLTRTIVDMDRHIAMLTTYRDRLQQLEQQASDDIESLIKVTSELTNVQSQIEELTGEANYQKQRADMEIVNINLIVDYGTSLWRPIRDALGAFVRNVSEGVSQVITTVAFLLPWSLLLLAAGFIVRKLRARRRGTRSGDKQ